MSKIKTAAFITVHVGPNFGSNLQAIATSEILKKVGVQPILINYIPRRCTHTGYWHDAFISIKSFIKSVIKYPLFCVNNKIYGSYLSKFVKMTSPIYPWNNFADVAPKVDLYITGSDQVWNFIYNEGLDEFYFFTGVKGHKIALSSSIGQSALSKEEYSLLKDRTSDYLGISVRESDALDIIKSFNRPNQECAHLIDPVLFLSSLEWDKFTSPLLTKEPYVFVYLPYNTIDEAICYDTAYKIAEKRNLRVLSISNSYFSCRRADKTFRYSCPGDFLSLMKNAEYIVTNSFHGVAFSITLNRNFWCYLPSKFANRILSVTKLFGLSNRVLTEVISDDMLDCQIDYKTVNQLLLNERNKGLRFIEKFVV